MLIAGDVYRPAAIDQLVILGEQVPEFASPRHFFKKELSFQFMLCIKCFMMLNEGDAIMSVGFMNKVPWHKI